MLYNKFPSITYFITKLKDVDALLNDDYYVF